MSLGGMEMASEPAILVRQSAAKYGKHEWLGQQTLWGSRMQGKGTHWVGASTRQDVVSGAPRAWAKSRTSTTPVCTFSWIMACPKSSPWTEDS